MDDNAGAPAFMRKRYPIPNARVTRLWVRKAEKPAPIGVLLSEEER